MPRKNRPAITQFFRKKREGINSIETVFSILDNQLLRHNSIQLPYEGASPLILLKNIYFAYRHRSQFNHITGDVHYIALGLGRKTVLTIHDVKSALSCSNLIKRFYIFLFWFWLPALIVKRITVISEFTKQELEKLIPFAKDKIVVIHNAFNPAIEFETKDSSRTPVILHMGTKPNKNLERTLEALKGIHCYLIVVGKLTEKQKKMMDDGCVGYENHYDVSFEEIVSYYKKCDIVSFPSTYEGFGVPILEANAAGRPIIAGDIPALREVAGDAACFVNPYSIESIRDGFLKVIYDNDYRALVVNNGFDNISRFAPQVIASEYNSIYNGLKDE